MKTTRKNILKWYSISFVERFCLFNIWSIVSRSDGQWFFLMPYSLRFSFFLLLFLSAVAVYRFAFCKTRTFQSIEDDNKNRREEKNNILQRLYKIIIICIIPNKVDKTFSFFCLCRPLARLPYILSIFFYFEWMRVIEYFFKMFLTSIANNNNQFWKWNGERRKGYNGLYTVAEDEGSNFVSINDIN